MPELVWMVVWLATNVALDSPRGEGIQGGLQPQDRREGKGSGFGIFSRKSEGDGLGLRVEG